MKNKKSIALVGIVFAFLIGWGVILTLFNPQNPAQASFFKPTVTINDPVLKALDGQIRGYDEQLKNDKLDVAKKKKLQAEQEYAKRQATRRADFLQTPSDVAYAAKQTLIARNALTPSPTHEDPRRRVTPGLQEFTSFQWAMDANFSTSWLQFEGDDYVLYFAGHLKSDYDQGVIYSFNHKTLQAGRYLSIEKAGDLIIKGADKGRLLIDTTKGKKVFFDTNAKKYASSVDGPLIEVTIIFANTPANSVNPLDPGYPAP